jgi:hypothetical protein
MIGANEASAAKRMRDFRKRVKRAETQPVRKHK